MKKYSEEYTGKKFHPEIDKRYPFAILVGKTIVLRDAIVINSFQGNYSTSDLAVMLFSFDGQGKDDVPVSIKFTSATSGKAIVRAIKKIIADKSFPIEVMITKEHGERGDYYAFKTGETEAPEIPETEHIEMPF